MFPDGSGLPITGGLFVTCALYAGLSLFVTGPVVGERTIDRMGWTEQCAAHIRAGVEVERPAAPAVPKLGCNELFGMWFGREGAEFCAVHGGVFADNPINRALDAAEGAGREVQRKRMEYAASRAGSRCDCAATVTLEARRLPLAIYAGSARLITPPSIRRLGSDLDAALNGPACAMKG